jgi:hypothetical protein
MKFQVAAVQIAKVGAHIEADRHHFALVNVTIFQNPLLMIQFGIRDIRKTCQKMNLQLQMPERKDEEKLFLSYHRCLKKFY